MIDDFAIFEIVLPAEKNKAPDSIKDTANGNMTAFSPMLQLTENILTLDYILTHS